MAEQITILHFSDGTKIICGAKTGTPAKGEQVVTCKRCLALLRQPENSDVDPNAVHFSDGSKAICGANNKSTASTDRQKVTCVKCGELMVNEAKKVGDPLIKVRVKNMDIPDGTDFNFIYEHKGYILVSNREEPYLLPTSVVKHLENLAYPYKRFIPGMESGQAMQVKGKRDRFAVRRM